MKPIDYIIPTWNSGTTLELTLKSIKKYGNPNNIIIVDKNSEDNTLEIAHRYGCKIITCESNLGTARIEGAKAAETELIGFVDSDVELTEGWRELLRYSWNGQEKYKDAGVFGAYCEGPVIK
ncbi:MAG: glycosyltransferase family 2 protein, partial [Methanothrix sp.]